MKTEYLERANRIATDNVSSAQQVLKDTLGLLYDFSMENCETESFVRELKSLATNLSNAQSQMSALSNICRLVVSAPDKLKPEEMCPYLDALLRRVGDASSKTAEHALRLITDDGLYATLSQSEFVLKSFELAADQGKIATVYVMESRPLFEGRQTARALKKMGHRPILVSDASIGAFITFIDSAFVGADAILSDGTLINKIGSYSLAAACAVSKKKFYAVTSVLKYDSEKSANTFINKEESTHEIFANPELEVRNFYFDKVDGGLVTALITEIGMVSPVSEIGKLNAAMREMYG
ncbi:MAG: hypothetical protein M1469_03085 [Bacteroidetes bacterium]|nr:hypothetical protein [Bacteroidota bacterium]